ncbi:DNA polymerase III, delta subunit [Legionella beliardensis]|uniref:DNA polymerase III subunit delta n=1 Tax=Legionella beliardensis TaxID=91822 RepID=A0A378I2R6_9GAMM|nr:DNA polymerase III subunit delta [Legionella beliardensis]STX29030.1 DNA polymerase III, delta subunit [Legionella beliardensis]
MLVKHNSLTVQLPKQLPAVFFLLGQELFQINQLLEAIKLAWRQHQRESETIIFSIESTTDWASLEQTVNSYSLFTEARLIDIRYDKKTLEPAGKLFFSNYLNDPNPDCLLLFKSSNLTVKQLQPFLNHSNAYIMQTMTPSSTLIKKWLQERLQPFGITDPHISTLIYQFNEGNLFACAQLLEKLKLINEPNTPLTLTDIKEHLHNQCNYSLFELAETCLSGDTLKVIQLLRQTLNNKTEPALILWLLTQEIRLLLQLSHLISQGQAFQAVANQLKIWSTKHNLYQNALKKYDHHSLSCLLKHCNKIDKQIKTTQSKQIWQHIELVAISLSKGNTVGTLA